MSALRTCRALLLLLLPAACRSEATLLKPAAGALSTTEIAQIDDGVRFTVETRPWPGDATINREVTVLHVRIENGGRQPLLVRHSDFFLTSPRGTRYLALPPVKVRGTTLQVETHREWISPAFEYVGFRAAPYYASIFPEIPVYAGFVADASYYGYYDYWGQTELPTPAMLARGLPEGVIEAGGRLTGWLYFQKLEEKEQRVALRASFENPVTGASVATFDIALRR